MLIPLKLVRDQPLQQQLYEQLRDLIVSARLMSGTRMPSTRMLADQFSVSRITVLLTYERLIAEGTSRQFQPKGHSSAIRRTSRRCGPRNSYPRARAFHYRPAGRTHGCFPPVVGAP